LGKRPYRQTDDFDLVAEHLKEHHKIDKQTASDRLHDIKQDYGLRGDENVILDYTGNVFFPTGLDPIGSLTIGGKTKGL